MTHFISMELLDEYDRYFEETNKAKYILYVSIFIKYKSKNLFFTVEK